MSFSMTFHLGRFKRRVAQAFLSISTKADVIDSHLLEADRLTASTRTQFECCQSARLCARRPKLRSCSGMPGIFDLPRKSGKVP